jgi:RDD family
MAVSEPTASLGRRIEALALAPLLCIVTLGVGWLIWCVVEWGHGRTPSYRLLGLRVVRISDEQPIRLARSFARSSICLLLVVPTIVACVVIGLSFVFGASAPEDLLRHPRSAPWDRLTDTKVVDERPQSSEGGGAARATSTQIDLTGIPSAPEGHTNGRAH